MVGESPAPVTPGQEARLQVVTASQADRSTAGQASAPAEPHQPHRQLTRPMLPREAGTYPERPQKAWEKFDPPKAMSEGPQFTLRLPSSRGPGVVKAPATDKMAGKSLPLLKGPDGAFCMDPHHNDSELRCMPGREVASTLSTAPISESNKRGDQTPEDRPEGWGREFKIEWLRTERLPFHRTRHLRNPWNHDREVKVSRDGTELEPGVGQKLLDEWEVSPPQAETSSPTSPTSPRGRGSMAPSRPAGSAASAVLSVSIPSLSSQLHRTNLHEGVRRSRGTR